MIPNYLTGKAGELWVCNQLRQLGFSVEHIGGNANYDVLVDGRARVEVKSSFLTSKTSGGQAYQFSLRRHGKPVDEDLLILLCYEDVTQAPLAAFVIPGEAVPEKLYKIDITNKYAVSYRGKWAKYINAWGLVADIVTGCPPGPQGELFKEPDSREISF